MVSIFSGHRANSIGYVEEGTFDFGLGRHVVTDDDKGLPDGVQDDSLYEVHVGLGLFSTDDITSTNYKSNFDHISQPIYS